MNFEMIRGEYERERIRFDGENGDTVIGTIYQDGMPVAVKGKEDLDEPLSAGHSFTFFGGWSNYKNKHSGRIERQFQWFSYTEDEDAAQQIAEVLVFLGRRGFYRTTAKEVVKRFGALAIRTIERNPYHLLRFRGCGFKRVDSLYMELGLPPDKAKRQTLCGAYALEANSNGSTWVPLSVLEASIRQSIDGAEPDVWRALRLGVRAGILSTIRTDDHDGSIEWDGDFVWVAREPEAAAERRLAASVLSCLQEPPRWPEITRGMLSPHQLEQLLSATSGNIGLLLGGGGVGKTYTIARLIQCLLASRVHPNQIALCAPTGKAAVRMTEQIIEAGITGMRAKTYHSLLGYSGNGFRHDETNPLDCRVIIGDETSMVDTRLMQCLLRARPSGCPVLFVGDPYQLPPVGSGAPFRDLTEICPKGELTEVHRNAGTIMLAGQDIRRGVNFKTDDRIDLAEKKNLIAIEATSPSQQVSEMLRAIKEAQSAGYDPMEDIQVLGIVNKRSELSVSSVNELLQVTLNGDSPQIPKCIFRVGDRVINTQNGWLTPRGYVDPDATKNESGAVYVANGEQGRVMEIHQKYMVIKIESPTRHVMSPRKAIEEESEEGQTGCDFQLAYCITSHKSQGSQWPVIICLIDEYYGARRIADRSMYYTMITRARDYCVLIGKSETVYSACRKAVIDSRKTFLKEQLGWQPQRSSLSIALSPSS